MATSATSRQDSSREAWHETAAPDIDPASSLLLTDLYELNMLQAYLEAGMTEPAVFEFFVRKLPDTRGFLMAAGLEQVVEFLEAARFTEPELEWLAGSGRFSKDMLDHLAGFRCAKRRRAALHRHRACEAPKQTWRTGIEKLYEAQGGECLGQHLRQRSCNGARTHGASQRPRRARYRLIAAGVNL